MCLFLFLALREEVSWQLTPGQRFETASYNLIRNHLCTSTSPLESGFYRHTLSPSLSQHLTSPPPPFVLSLCFILGLSPPSRHQLTIRRFQRVTVSLFLSTLTCSLLRQRKRSEPPTKYFNLNYSKNKKIVLLPHPTERNQ